MMLLPPRSGWGHNPMSPRRNFLLTSIKLALRPPDKPKVRIWTDCKANRAYWKDEMEADNEAQLNSYRQPGIKHRASLSIEGRADAGQAVDFQYLIIRPSVCSGLEIRSECQDPGRYRSFPNCCERTAIPPSGDRYLSVYQIV